MEAHVNTTILTPVFNVLLPVRLDSIPSNPPGPRYLPRLRLNVFSNSLSVELNQKMNKFHSSLVKECHLKNFKMTIKTVRIVSVKLNLK